MTENPSNSPLAHRISNPLTMAQGGGNEPSVTTGTAMMAAETQRSIAEVQAAYMMAQARPRNTVMALDRMINECARPTLAEQAVYSYPRGGVEVTGPTIRLAEMVARNWGNIKCGWRCLDRKPGRSLIQAFAVDLETNFMDDIVFEVPHFRDTKQGRKPLTDDRDIYEMEANQAARRLRKCLLTLIPGDIIDTCLEQCELTLQSTSKNDIASIRKMVGAFIPFGVNVKMIEARLGRKIETISAAQVANFKKIYTSLKDGMSEAKDWFDVSLADKEPVDTTLNETKQPAAKKTGKATRSKKDEKSEQPQAEKKAEDSKASDTQDFNRKHAQRDEPLQQNQPNEQQNDTNCEKCGGSGVIQEEDDEGEVIEYACSRCSSAS